MKKKEKALEKEETIESNNTVFVITKEKIGKTEKVSLIKQK